MEKIIARHIQQFTKPEERLGATLTDDGVYIRLWAPCFKEVEIEWVGSQRNPLTPEDRGYFSGFFPDAKAGDRYYFYCDGKRIADPASRYQPEGTSGPSEVVPMEFSWTDHNWSGTPLEEWVIYEIHTGTFSEKYNFEGIIDDLPRLKSLGITTIEIMPVSQFSGGRNWGYDGVFPHAVQNTYGGPEGLKKLVNACHEHGLSIILDVVYNHIGPEGNILFDCGPYKQSKYHTPWGDAINFDGEGSDDVRRYFLQTAWQWLTEYHFDGLRLDAVQTIMDNAPTHFLAEISALKNEAEKITGRPLFLTAETDMNDPRILEPVSKNGFGFDGHWSDDLHHALHATLTGEKFGYYEDYGGAKQIAKIYKQGVAFAGEFSPFRKRTHGRSYEHIAKHKLIVETQNHDQVGNRLMGERLSNLVSLDKLKLAAGCIFLSPFLPFVFMGEEFASKSPFFYFISHESPELLEMVRKGRKEEWKDFKWSSEPPDPVDQSIFDQCVLKDKTNLDDHALAMQAYYRELIKLSKKIRLWQLEVNLIEEDDLIALHYRNNNEQILAILSFNEKNVDYILDTNQNWNPILQSASYDINTSKITLPAYSVSVFERT